MAARYRWVALTALLVLALVAFLTGRHVEAKAQETKVQGRPRALTSPRLAINTGPPSHRQLAVTEIIRLPFADFYEALRSAPAEARKKWAAELEAMPEGPQRTAAICGFYKLLVQFDPVAAAKAIIAISDAGLQNLALASAVDAAPGFGMGTIAELSLALKERTSGRRSYLMEVLGEWTLIDAAAVAQFVDEHPELDNDQSLLRRELIATLAALDPKAAKEWMEKKGRSDEPDNRRAFFEGWYEHDRAAVVSYVLAHANEPDMKKPLSDTLRALWADSEDEAKKFIEALPDESLRRDVFHGAFEYFIPGEEKDLGEPKLTPQAVGNWMTQFPPEYWKGKLSEIFKWSRNTSPEMLVWIAQQPPSIRDSVAAEYRKPFHQTITQTVESLLQVPDPRLREQLFTAVFEHSDETDEAVSRSVTDASLSPAQKQYVLEILKAVKAADNSDQGSEK
jgi:hypothetical protein